MLVSKSSYETRTGLKSCQLLFLLFFFCDSYYTIVYATLLIERVIDFKLLEQCLTIYGGYWGS